MLDHIFLFYHIVFENYINHNYHLLNQYVTFEKITQFVIEAFKGYGIPEEDAKICADVLIASDKKGIDSHGVNRFKPIYLDRIKIGIQNPVTDYEIVRETPTTAVVDGRVPLTAAYSP